MNGIMVARMIVVSSVKMINDDNDGYNNDRNNNSNDRNNDINGSFMNKFTMSVYVHEPL